MPLGVHWPELLILVVIWVLPIDRLSLYPPGRGQHRPAGHRLGVADDSV